MDTHNTVKEQAIKLAKFHKEYESQISAFYWFPHQKEVRLIEVEKNIPISLDGRVTPFYFGPSPAEGLRLPIAMAIIRPEEVRKLKLPRGWNWDKAEKLKIN